HLLPHRLDVEATMLRTVTLEFFAFAGFPAGRLDRVDPGDPTRDRRRIIFPIVFAHTDDFVARRDWFDDQSASLGPVDWPGGHDLPVFPSCHDRIHRAPPSLRL